jgi:hypothetical protein
MSDQGDVVQHRFESQMAAVPSSAPVESENNTRPVAGLPGQPPPILTGPDSATNDRGRHRRNRPRRRGDRLRPCPVSPRRSMR